MPTDKIYNRINTIELFSIRSYLAWGETIKICRGRRDQCLSYINSIQMENILHWFVLSSHYNIFCYDNISAFRTSTEYVQKSLYNCESVSKGDISSPAPFRFPRVPHGPSSQSSSITLVNIQKLYQRAYFCLLCNQKQSGSWGKQHYLTFRVIFQSGLPIWHGVII